MTNTANAQETIEQFIVTAQAALQIEQDKFKRWKIRRIIQETTERLERMKGA